MIVDIKDDLTSHVITSDGLLECNLPNYNPETLVPFSSREDVQAFANELTNPNYFRRKLTDEEAEEARVAKFPADQAASWERIKAERDSRKVLGVKVGAHWFHSDADSRIQQLGLVIMGASVPAVQWKTLTPNGSSVFVTMTQAIAAGIFQNTAASDTAIFEAAEMHRLAMEASSTPESYEFTSGWPISIEDQAD
jgi:hypothetical protein